MRTRSGVILSLVAATVLGGCEWFPDPTDSAGDPPARYSVTYLPNGAEEGTVPVDETQYGAGDTATVLGNTGALTRAGYSFVGWSTDADGGGTTHTSGETFTVPDADVTLYAAWTSDPTYTVTYDENGADSGAVPVDTMRYEEGATVTALGNTGGLTRAGYSFVGWNTEANGNGTQYQAGGTFAIGPAGVTLFAQWTAVYSVSYDDNASDSGTVPVDSSAYTEGESVPVIGNTGSLRKTGSEFTGWNTAAIGTGTDRAPGDTFAMPGADQTLYAQWSPFGFVAATPTETANYNGIAFGGGLFVAINYNGTDRVMTSPNGVDWTARTAAEENAWSAVTYGDGLFVAVSTNGTNRVMTSADGASWTAQAAAAANDWVSVTYGNGTYVAVSLNGANQVMTSPDGTTWTARTAASAGSWSSVAYGNGLFVAVNQGGAVMTSPDGITWTSQTASETNGWQWVTYGEGLFVAVANSGTNRVMTSSDGITWTARQAAEDNQWVHVTYGDGLFVAVSATGTNRAMTSADGITWNATPGATDNSWEAVVHGSGRFVAVGAFGAADRVMYADWAP